MADGLLKQVPSPVGASAPGRAPMIGPIMDPGSALISRPHPKKSNASPSNWPSPSARTQNSNPDMSMSKV